MVKRVELGIYGRFQQITLQNGGKLVAAQQTTNLRQIQPAQHAARQQIVEEVGDDEGGGRDDGRKAEQGDTGATGEKVGKAESDEQAEKGEQAKKGEKDDKGKQGRDDNGSDDEEAKPEKDEKAADAGDLVLVELAVLPGSVLVGRSASDILLRTRYGLNLLAVSRQGQRSMVRLRSLALRAGDLLLMQGAQESIAEFASDNGCVPLAERELRIPDRRKAITAALVMLASVGVAAFGLLPAATAFLAGVLASMALRTVPPRAVYDAVDWPVIVLLAALIPPARWSPAARPTSSRACCSRASRKATRSARWC